WGNWNKQRGPMALVAAAILAANPHNSQPWVFELSPDRINVFADQSRNIGAVDPLRREMYVGLGAALENLMLAAPANGYRANLQQWVDDNRWFRHDWDAIQRYKDGLTIDAQALPELTAAIAKLLPATSRQYNDTFWVKRTRDPQAKTAAAYGIVAVRDPHSNV